MPWFKVDDHVSSHPATLKAGNSALGAWVRAGCWLATFPRQDDFIPGHMWRLFGNRRELARLIDAGLLVPQEDGYSMRRGMNIVGSGLSGSFWAVQRSDVRGAIPERLRQSVYARDEYQCVTCGSTDDLTLDHIHPWSLGGEDTYENLRTLCRSCNSRKGARI